MQAWGIFTKKNIGRVIIVLMIAVNPMAFAAPALPGSAEPGRVQQNFLPPQKPTLKPLQPISMPQEKPTGLGPEAEKIKFVLKKLIFEGNHVYTDEQLLPLYKNKLNTTISIAELQSIVQNITNFYRNNGYILSRAILPPQHVTGGIIHVRIIEGYIDKVSIV